MPNETQPDKWIQLKGELQEWSEGGVQPDCLNIWSFETKQLKFLQAACGDDVCVSFLVLCLQSLTDEDAVVEIIQTVKMR